jgi:hypothetical protein
MEPTPFEQVVVDAVAVNFTGPEYVPPLEGAVTSTVAKAADARRADRHTNNDSDLSI